MLHYKHKSILIAFFSTMVRFYDYSLFGLSAGVISKEFMPFASQEDQLFGFFTLFSAAMFMRPLGSIIFGNIGDKIGRITSVKIAALLAAASTLVIGLIPSYDQIGAYATLFLLFARVLFLFSLAGEIDAIKIYVSEMVSNSKRCFASSLVTFSSQIGVLIAAISYYYTVGRAGSEELWRYSFIAGGVLGLFVFLIRSGLVESELFMQTRLRINLQKQAEREQNSAASKEEKESFKEALESLKEYEADEHIFEDMHLFKVIKYHKLKFTLATIISGLLGGVYNFLIIFLATFSGEVAGVITVADASFLNVKLISIYALGAVISGLLADRLNYYRQVYTALLVGFIIVMIAAFAAFHDSYSAVYHKLIVFSVPFFMIPTHVKLQSLFSSAVRMRMSSLSHSLGSMIFSSPTPVFAMLMWKMTNLFFMVLLMFGLQLCVLTISIGIMRRQSYENMLDT